MRKSKPDRGYMYGPDDHSLRTFVRGAARRASAAGIVTDIRTVRALDMRIHTLGDRCYWCGDPWTEIDHVIPLSRGGLDMLANVVPACSPCNGSKSNHEASWWIANRKR